LARALPRGRVRRAERAGLGGPAAPTELHAAKGAHRAAAQRLPARRGRGGAHGEGIDREALLNVLRGLALDAAQHGDGGEDDHGDQAEGHAEGEADA